jgi:hypothetical protein
VANIGTSSGTSLTTNSIYKTYKRTADKINWKEQSNSQLFFNYIKNENDLEMRDVYFSAIVCKYYGLAGRMYSQCQKHISFEECTDCIIDAAKYVLEKRVWENPSSSIHNDSTGPDKAMHIAIKRQKNIMLSKYSAYRRQSNFNTLSLDEFKEDYNDAGEGWLINIDAPVSNKTVYTLVSSYFAKDDYLDGFLLDLICYSNYKIYDSKRLISDLKNIKPEIYDYYKESYDAKKDTFYKTLTEIADMSNRLLNLKLKQLLYKLKKEEFNND